MGVSILAVGVGEQLTVTEVIPSDVISARVEELGRQISADYAGKVPVFVGVLTGCLMFHADLVRRVSIESETDFLALSRFGEGGRVRLAMDTHQNLEGRDVLIVEDIVDTGLTLQVLRKTLEARGCASVKTVALLDKSLRRIANIPIEYRGFEIGDEFLLGYGLDWEQKFRNLPSLWAVLDLARFADDPSVLFEAAKARSGDSLQT
jgi:hypoxanthine phosphoribosyltransferase